MVNQNIGFKYNVAYFLLILFVLCNCNFGLVNGANVIIQWNNPMITNITVNIGDTVTWMTSDSVLHTITSINKKDHMITNNNQNQVYFHAPHIILDSPPITNNQSLQISSFSEPSLRRKYSVTFVQEGMYYYNCQYFPETMQGSINVISTPFDPDENSTSSKQTFLSLFFACVLGFLIFFVFS